MKKKVVFITKALWIGGIETALINLLDNFDYDLYDVTLLITKAELDLLSEVNSNVKVVIIDRDKTYSFEKNYRFTRLFNLIQPCENPSIIHHLILEFSPILNYVENYLFIKYVKNLLKTNRYDTAIIYSDAVAELGIRAIKAKQYLMFYHHGSMRHTYHDEIAYKKCNHIIAVSENLSNSLKTFLPKYSHKICAIQNLTNSALIQKKSEEFIEEQFDKHFINIVTVGRVAYEKGMDIAVQICAKLVYLGYSNIRWWIVGDGPKMDELCQEIKHNHMEKYINLVGMKSNPYPYIKKADLYVQPSRVESYGLTIIEAMILGKVVVSTDTFGAKELIVHKSNGILTTKNIDTFSNAIIDTLSNRELMNHIETNLVNYDYEKGNKDKLKKIYELL